MDTFRGTWHTSPVRSSEILMHHRAHQSHLHIHFLSSAWKGHSSCYILLHLNFLCHPRKAHRTSITASYLQKTTWFYAVKQEWQHQSSLSHILGCSHSLAMAGSHHAVQVTCPGAIHILHSPLSCWARIGLCGQQKKAEVMGYAFKVKWVSASVSLTLFCYLSYFVSLSLCMSLLCFFCLCECVFAPLFVCLCVQVSLSLHVCFSLHLCFPSSLSSLSLPIFVYLCLSVSSPVSVCLFVSYPSSFSFFVSLCTWLFSLCLPLFLHFSVIEGVCVCLTLCLCLCVSLFCESLCTCVFYVSLCLLVYLCVCVCVWVSWLLQPCAEHLRPLQAALWVAWQPIPGPVTPRKQFKWGLMRDPELEPWG
jgi:hypothetical protein